MLENWTGERLETFVYNETATEHLHRYAIAIQFTEDKRVLDIACGEGYGSFLIANNAKSIIGVDIDINTIKKASEKYVKDNLIFLAGTTSNIPVEDKSIDVVTSFETIEHHNEHERMLEEIKRVLKDDGVLIISSPEKKYYSDVSGDKNSFHIKELYLSEFKNLINKYFRYHNFYFQTYVRGSLIFAEENETQKISVVTGDYNNIQSDKLNGMYNICIASQLQPPPPLGISFFDDKIIYEIQRIQLINKYNEQLRENTNIFKNSLSFRIGQFITAPFRWFRRTIMVSRKQEANA